MKRKRRERLTRHHLHPKCRGGSDSDHNLLFLWWEKHRAWHELFGNRTLPEIIEVLQRIERVKGRPS